MIDLSSLGFGPFFQRQLSSPPSNLLIPARVAAEHRGGYEVWCADGEGMATLAGRLRHELTEAELPSVGDWVALDRTPLHGAPALIERVLERRTLFTRAAAGRSARVQVIAANVDLVFAVAGLDADFNVRRIERYLARIAASGADAAIVLSKADLCPDVATRVAELERHCAGVPTFVTNALAGDGVAALRAQVHDGTTVAFVGSSGAGKSTLVNALLGASRMPTGDVRAHDARGRHTTTARQLVRMPAGGVLLDTPGMRELSLLDDQGLDAVFGDIVALATRCRYADCSHVTEPGCAVNAAVREGALDAERLTHLRKLQREAAASSARLAPMLRRRAARLSGQLSDEAAQLRRWKGGKA